MDEQQCREKSKTQKKQKDTYRVEGSQASQSSLIPDFGGRENVLPSSSAVGSQIFLLALVVDPLNLLTH